MDDCTVRVAGRHSVRGEVGVRRRRKIITCSHTIHIYTKHLLVRHICNTIPQRGLIRYNCSRKLKPPSYLGCIAPLQFLETFHGSETHLDRLMQFSSGSRMELLMAS